ncbi:MAG: YggT family protein [Deltaproteobacteria bacterium]|nr:YggT family protein [Deltaproteobacteria bacterium]
MFALSNLLVTLARLLDLVLDVYFYVIIARALISWVNPDPYNPIVRFLYQATEPVLGRIRRHLPDMGGLDVSPIIVIFAIKFLQWFVIATLIDMAFRLKTGGAI